jgi:hypothetical protein
MPYADDTRVRNIIETSKADLTQFLTAADSLVEEKLVGQGYADTRLALIADWLAAHFIAVADAEEMVVQDRAGSSTTVYASPSMRTDDAGLNYTRYGRQALLFDTKGLLQGLGRMKATFRVSGCSGRRRWI